MRIYIYVLRIKLCTIYLIKRIFVKILSAILNSSREIHVFSVLFLIDGQQMGISNYRIALLLKRGNCVLMGCVSNSSVYDFFHYQTPNRAAVHIFSFFSKIKFSYLREEKKLFKNPEENYTEIFLMKLYTFK